MVSISQWIYSHLPSDADLGLTPKALDDATLVMVALGLVKMTRNVAAAAAELRPSALNVAAEQTLQRILAADDAAFAQAWKNTAPAGQMGAI